MNAADGAIDPVWGGPETPSLTRRVDVMEVHGSTVFVAGTFTDFRGQVRNNLAAVDIPTSALLPWYPPGLGDGPGGGTGTAQCSRRPPRLAA